MISLVIVDDTPVAVVGASRWYPTPRFDELDPADRAAIAATCDRLVGAASEAGRHGRSPSP